MLDLNLVRELVVDLNAIGTKSITLTGGGEPLTHPNINAMIKAALHWDLQVGLVTNGIALDKLKEPESLTFIRVSIDAATPETYHKIKKDDWLFRVMSNISNAIDRGAFVGLSYVITADNVDEIDKARVMARELGVKYIQFKPSCDPSGGFFRDFEIPEGDGAIFTDRHISTDMTPCQFAQLIGVVGADGCVYFCCQKRGDPNGRLGDLRAESFGNIWRRHRGLRPDVSKCPQCRYMNYVVEFDQLTKDDLMFFDHRFFL
jgi:MoaA/NifB/PqqE/SkfB family radical SAM enzyme